MKRIHKIFILSFFLLPMFSSCDIVSINQTSSIANTSLDDSISEVTSLSQEVTSNGESSSETSEVSTSEESKDDYPDKIAIIR